MKSNHSIKNYFIRVCIILIIISFFIIALVVFSPTLTLANAHKNTIKTTKNIDKIRLLQLYFYYATDKGYADYTEILKRRRDQVIGKLIDKKLALSLQPYIRRPSYQGYYYSLIVSADRKKYVLWAVPTEYGKSGLRSYWMSSLNWRIYAFDAKELTIEMLEYKDSPPKGYYELGSRF